MQYTELFRKPPAINPPSDIAHLVEELAKIPRFKHPEYPSGIFDDNVLLHTQRCVAFTLQIKLPTKEEAGIVRTLWIHDIPELITSDITAVEKDENPLLLQKLQQEEVQAINSLLKPADQKQLVAFNDASYFLKAKSNNTDLSLPALIAKIIDGIDGNLGFHYQLTRWVVSQKDQTVLPPERAILHTFSGKARFETQLGKLDKSIRDITIPLVSVIQSEVNLLWQKVPYSLWPEVIKAELR